MGLHWQMISAGIKDHINWTKIFSCITTIQTDDVIRDIDVYIAEREQQSCSLVATATFQGMYVPWWVKSSLSNFLESSPKQSYRLRKRLPYLWQRMEPTGFAQECCSPVILLSILHI